MVEKIAVEVVFAETAEQRVATVKLPASATVADALAAARLDPEIQQKITAGEFGVGIHGRLVTMDQVVQDQNRVEIYRPLIKDPKTARHERAARQKAKAGR